MTGVEAGVKKYRMVELEPEPWVPVQHT